MIVSECCKAAVISTDKTEAKYYFKCTKCGKGTPVIKQVKESEGKK